MNSVITPTPIVLTGIPHVVNFIPNTWLDDFFFFGFVSGAIGYLYFLFTNSGEQKNHVTILMGIYGMFLSGFVAGMLAIVFDNSIIVSILVGLFHQLVYMALVKATKSGEFFTVLKEVMVKYLTLGEKDTPTGFGK